MLPVYSRTVAEQSGQFDDETLVQHLRQWFNSLENRRKRGEGNRRLVPETNLWIYQGAKTYAFFEEGEVSLNLQTAIPFTFFRTMSVSLLRRPPEIIESYKSPFT